MSHTILVVDDHPEFLDLYRLILKRIGYTIYTATHGKTALHYTSQHHFDLIIMDVMMPDLSGYEICQQLIRQTPSTLVPVIMVSATGDLDFPNKARQAGAVGYLRKPFSLYQLLDCVHDALQHVSLLPSRLPVFTDFSLDG